MTSQGALPPLNTYSRNETKWACQLSGYVRIQYNPEIKSEELVCLEPRNIAALNT